MMEAKNRKTRRAEESHARRATRGIEKRLRGEFERSAAAYQSYCDKADDLDYLRHLEADNERLQKANDYYMEELQPYIEAMPLRPNHVNLEVENLQLRREVAMLSHGRQTLTELPRDLEGVVDLVGTLHYQRIVFSDDAIASAKAAQCQDIHAGWRLLHAAATTLHDMYSSDVKDIEHEFLSVTGIELALTEGSVTNKNRRLRRRRELVCDGITMDVSAHLKWGNRAPKLLRVHYAYVKEIGQIVVGHCGDHLPTAGDRCR